MEFTPFEYGIAKYGVFGKMKDFGGKFYKGKLVKPFEEPPLSYLQGELLVIAVQRIIFISKLYIINMLYYLGIWGSAFGIILHTLLYKKDKSEPDLQEEISKYSVFVDWILYISMS